MNILIKDQQNHRRLNKAKIKKVARKVLSLLEQPRAELSILFVNDKKMQQLNDSYKGIAKTTDVLSFPQVEFGVRHLKSDDGKMGRWEDKQILTFPPLNFLSSKFQNSSLLLGDIVISTQTAAAQARMSGVDFYDEISRLLIHGILHLIGYNHEGSRYMSTTMRKKEKEILNAIKKMG